MEDAAVYLAVKLAIEGAKAGYRAADKVEEYADSKGISKKEAWFRVRAEAAKRGDNSVERAADFMLRLGPVGSVPVPGGPIRYSAAQGWKALKRLRR